MIDLSHLNEFVLLTLFKMETVASVLLSVREGDFLDSINLKDAYFQIPVHQTLGKLLRFLSEGTVFQFKDLCFRLSIVPQVFTKVFAAVSALAHSHGIRLLRYLDNWLVLASSEAEAKKNVQDLLSLCHSLGIVINEEKSDLVPSQTANCLGMTIATGAARIFPSHARVEKFLSVAETFLYYVRFPRSALAGGFGIPGFAGETSSSQSPLNALSAVAFEDALVSRVGSSLPSCAFILGGEGGFVLVDGGGPYSQGGSVRDTRSGSTPVCSRMRLGWGGAHTSSIELSRMWSEQEKLLHINLLKMKALFLALQSFQELVAGRRVTAMCDNSTVVAYVNKQGGTVSRFLCSLASQLLRWSESLNVHFDARYLPGQSNVLADLLSCRDQVIGIEWSLHPQVAKDLLRRWGLPSIDLFATSLSAKLPLYCTLVPDPQAVFEDVFHHP